MWERIPCKRALESCICAAQCVYTIYKWQSRRAKKNVYNARLGRIVSFLSADKYIKINDTINRKNVIGIGNLCQKLVFFFRRETDIYMVITDSIKKLYIFCTKKKLVFKSIKQNWHFNERPALIVIVLAVYGLTHFDGNFKMDLYG